MNLIYKSPILRGTKDIIYILLAIVIIPIPILTDGNWLFSLVILLLIIIVGLIKFKSVKVYEDKVTSISLLSSRSVDYSKIKIFRNIAGFGGGAFSLDYTENGEEKNIIVYIADRKDIDALTKFFSSKNIKINI